MTSQNGTQCQRKIYNVHSEKPSVSSKPRLHPFVCLYYLSGRQSHNFSADCCHNTADDGSVLAEGPLCNRLYFLNNSSHPVGSSSTVALVADLSLWHQRMPHVHVDGIRNMVRKNVVKGIKIYLSHNVSTCEACVYGKSSRAPIPKQGGARARAIHDVVHSDECGRLPEKSMGSSFYFMSFVYDHSRYCLVYAIKAKSDVYKTFVRWLTMG